MVDSIIETIAPFVMVIAALCGVWSVKMALDPMRRSARFGNWFIAAGNFSAMVMIASTIFIK